MKDEREQKNSLRRELSALTLNPFDSVGNLELHLDQLDDSQEEGREGEREGEAEDQDSGINNGPGSAPGSAHPPHLGGSKYNGLIHRYSTPRNSDVFLRAPASGLVSDLLSELQFSDSQKLKQQLLQVTQTRITHGTLTRTLEIIIPMATNFNFDGRDCCFERGGHFRKRKLLKLTITEEYIIHGTLKWRWWGIGLPCCSSLDVGAVKQSRRLNYVLKMH